MARYANDRLPPDRVAVVWAGKWIVLLAAVLMAALAALGSHAKTVSYSAQAKIQVSLLQTKGIGEQNALAANELAAQYAQLATTEPVLGTARTALGADAAGLSTAISATAINNYNLVGVTAVASSSQRAARQAAAVATALVDYVQTADDAQITAANKSSAARQQSLDAQIAELQKQIAQDTSTATGDGAAATAAQTALAGERSLLASLSADRESVFTANQRDLITAQPRLAVVDTPASGAAQGRHLALYALVGFAVGLVLIAEALVLVARVRYRIWAARQPWPPADLRDMSRL